MEVKQIASYPVVTCDPGATLAEVAGLMRDRHVGCAVVVDEHDAPKGIVTDRDLVVRAAADKKGFDTPIGLLMSTPVSYVYENDDLFSAATRMASAQCRRLPVLNPQGALVGIVALDDLVKAFSEQIQKLSYTIEAESKGHRSAA